jgi:hypothetical protein
MCDGAGHDVGVFSDRRCKSRSKNSKIHGRQSIVREEGC